MPQQVKDPALSLLWHRSLLWHGFHPRPRNFCMPQVQQEKKKRQKKKKITDAGIIGLREEAGMGLQKALNTRPQSLDFAL